VDFVFDLEWRPFAQLAASVILGSLPPLDRLQHFKVQPINEWQLSLDCGMKPRDAAKVWNPPILWKNNVLRAQKVAC